MKTMNVFIVEVDKPINDTIKTDSGFELFVDTRWDEFSHRCIEGKVVSSPLRLKNPVKEGDTLYFHHLVVLDGGQKLKGSENHYIVKTDPSFTINNQAFAYKSDDGEIRPLFGWTLLTPAKEEKELESSTIQLVELEERPVKTGIVALHCKELDELGIKVGDEVGFKKNMDYRLTIDDQEYYRVRAEDLLYVKEELHND
jgi:co-chaperonin GroES (HSP10)